MFEEFKFISSIVAIVGLIVCFVLLQLRKRGVFTWVPKSYKQKMHSMTMEERIRRYDEALEAENIEEPVIYEDEEEYDE